MEEAEAGAAAKVFDLDLPELGPYNLAFTRSGRHMLLGGRKGHLALMDWQQHHLVCEVQARCRTITPCITGWLQLFGLHVACAKGGGAILSAVAQHCHSSHCHWIDGFNRDAASLGAGGTPGSVLQKVCRGLLYGGES